MDFHDFEEGNMSFKGRRLPDTKQGSFPLKYDALHAGDIWKVLDPKSGEPIVVTDQPSNLTGYRWYCIVEASNGVKMSGNLIAHTVREHDDRTISVRAGDGSSNSILISRLPNESWHGYVEHNVWTEC